MPEGSNQPDQPNIEKGLVVAGVNAALPALQSDLDLGLSYDELDQRVLGAEGTARLKAALVARVVAIQGLPFEGVTVEIDLLTDGSDNEPISTSKNPGGMAITLTRLASLSGLILPREHTSLGITQTEAITRYSELLRVLWDQRHTKTMGHLPFVQSLVNIKAFFSALAPNYSGDRLIISFYASLGMREKGEFKGALIDSTLLSLIDDGDVLTHPMKFRNKLLKGAYDVIRAYKDDRTEGFEELLEEDDSFDEEKAQKNIDLDTALDNFASVWEEIDGGIADISNEGKRKFLKVIVNGYNGREASRVKHAIRILNEISDNDYSFISSQLFEKELSVSIALNRERIRRRKEEREKKLWKEEMERRKEEQAKEMNLESPIIPE